MDKLLEMLFSSGPWWFRAYTFVLLIGFLFWFVLYAQVRQGPHPPKTQELDHSIVQSMKNSPGAMQVAGDLNVNADRRIEKDVAEAIKNVLRSHPKLVTVGTVDLGEGTRLAEDFLQIAKEAGCQTAGVNRGIGFQPFDGIKLLYPIKEAPSEVILSLQNILNQAGLKTVVEPGSNLSPDSIYIYVGYKP